MMKIERWTLRVDRRVLDPEDLKPALIQFKEGIDGLQLEFIDALLFENLPDEGTFRDFAPVAIIGHAKMIALEHIAEELLETYGWKIDFQPRAWTPDQ